MFFKTYIVKDATWKYKLDWFLFPLLALVIAAFTFRTPDWLAWCAAGFVFWTFVEYWVHRSLLHVYFWHGTHEGHHKRPKDHVVFPLWYTPLIFTMIFVFYNLILPVTVLWPFFAGFILGYCWFLTMHHWLHHSDNRNSIWMRKYVIWHNRHHKLNNMNYGITTPMWDMAFGTSK